MIDNIEEYEISLKNEGNSPLTIIQYVSMLRDYKRFIEEKALIENNDAIRLYLQDKNYDSQQTIQRFLSVLKNYYKFMRSPIFFDIDKINMEWVKKE